MLTASLEEQDHDGCAADDDARPQERNAEEKIEGDRSADDFCEVRCRRDKLSLEPEKNTVAGTKALAKEGWK